MKKSILPFLLCFIIKTTSAQTIQALSGVTKTSIRGLSVVNDKTIWVSGSNGTVARSIDGGATWVQHQVPGFEKIEFRDIEAFDDMEAVIMAIDTPARILRTIDGGASWNLVFADSTAGMFLDAMEFWNEQSGIVIGDPIENRFFIARTFDGGRTWKPLPMAFRPRTDSGEACFASSGTNIRKRKKDEAVFVSGGKKSRLFVRDSSYNIPIKQGETSTGANSMAVKNKDCFMVVGGDFNFKDSTMGNVALTYDGGKTWVEGLGKPNGYRSCVEYINKKTWITCGLNGADITFDDGLHFTSISKTGYHVCRKAKKGKAVYFAGGQGRIGKLVN